MRLPSSKRAVARERGAGTLGAHGGRCLDARRRDIEGRRGGGSQAVVPSTPSGKGAAMRVAPRSSSARAVSARNGWASSNAGVRADRRQLPGSARRQEAHRRDAELGEEPRELILDHVGQRADDEQRGCRIGGVVWQVATSAARQASSPCVKVVSMPLPE